MELIEKILSEENLQKAIRKVKKNKGAPGVDKMTVQEVEEWFNQYKKELIFKILNKQYKPMPVKRVYIPKPNGKQRPLGIPTVVDRVIQQAMLQVLNEIYEPVFSEHSYGFRPNRSAHMAMEEVLGYLNDGYEWIVDLDIEKFFDTVNHDKLISILRERVNDSKTLHLIRAYLQAGVLDKGLVRSSTIGTPQGGPISVILSNIYLDKFDKELESRNLRFARYADYTEVETMPKLSLKHRRYQGFLLIISAYFFYYKRYRRSKVSGLLQLFIPLSGLTVSIAFARTSNVANA